MAAVEAENCGKLEPAGAVLFAANEDICDDHAGAMGVVDCGVEADMLAAPPRDGDAPLSAPEGSCEGLAAAMVLLIGPRRAKHNKG